MIELKPVTPAERAAHKIAELVSSNGGTVLGLHLGPIKEHIEAAIRTALAADPVRAEGRKALEREFRSLFRFKTPFLSPTGTSGEDLKRAGYIEHGRWADAGGEMLSGYILSDAGRARLAQIEEMLGIGHVSGAAPDGE